MISTPTTFVIGAGASRPYGLPLGADLLELARKINAEHDIFQLLLQLSIGGAAINRFLKDIRHTPVRSIDDYLAKRKDDASLVEVGRGVIACLMARAIMNQQPVPLTEDWLGQIVNWMSTSAHTRSDFDAGNRGVTFVTFNFDSIIEDRLTRDVEALYHNSTASDAPRITDVVKTIHVHGQLPTLPTGSTAQNPFARSLAGFTTEWVDWLRRAIDVINVVIDPSHSERVSRARQALAEATIVCFLGFGYDADNLESRLGIPGSLPNNGEMVFGSALDIPEGRRQWISDRFAHRMALAGPKDNCLATLRQFYVYRD
jgi:hypothetical protein